MTFLAGVLGVITAAAFALALVLGLAILSLLRPERSLQDQFAGTWLVPR